MIELKLNRYAKKVDNFLLNFLKRQRKSLLVSPMKYGVISGGKKIRSTIIFDTGKIFGIKENKLIRLYERLNVQTIDPISSMIEMSMYHNKDICTGEWEVTDGRRIFSIQFAQELEQNICTAKFIPLVGFSDKEMKKYEDNPVPLFMLQLMKITIKDEFIFLIPISINASEGISGSIDLVDLSINGKSIVF